MEIRSDYSLTKSFVTKDVTIFLEENKKTIDSFHINLVPLKDYYNNQDWLVFYNIINTPLKKLREQFNLKQELDLYDIFQLLIIELGKFKQYFSIYCSIINALKQIIPDFKIDLGTKNFSANDIVITRDIFNYVIYVIKLSGGERIEAPRQFASEAERALYLAQLEYEEQIKNIRQQKEGSQDAMMKVLLSITYAFPSFDFDYLFEQTLAQIRWLQKYAAEAASYEVNKEIFAAGNMRKGSKLNFFIK